MTPFVECELPTHDKPDRMNLLAIPVELRLKIFDYVMERTSINAVGYRKGDKDAFYFKERGNCQLMMTCKQFHDEGTEIYFKNLTVTIKAACPSEFTGDMSSFGSSVFRQRLRKITIADHDEVRRKRMSDAFENAQIEYISKSTNGGRKGAYYF